MARQRVDPPSVRSKEDDALHDLLLRIDRLEELIDEMDELEVSSRGEAESRMAELHTLVDALERD